VAHAPWTKAGLEADGFAPWVEFEELETALPIIPTKAAGVYVVVRDDTGVPAWLVPSPVGETWLGDPTSPARYWKPTGSSGLPSSISGRQSKVSYETGFGPISGSVTDEAGDIGAVASSGSSKMLGS
jgi:hypothetical protein